ncbi:hypothetical protein QE152_g37523 [Popillia japonica]|uniref:Retrotransposon gag domain-containing protein n=1 Tax=Popillia japonica TaxID=7064 RepID=A0AAW1I9W6_POPJA
MSNFVTDDLCDLATARAHLGGTTLNWCATHLRDIQRCVDFDRCFRDTFLRLRTAADKWDIMRNTAQRDRECITEYFLDKQRLCRELNLTIREAAICVKDYVVEEDILRDLIASLRNKIQKRNYYKPDKKREKKEVRVGADKIGPQTREIVEHLDEEYDEEDDMPLSMLIGRKETVTAKGLVKWCRNA